MAAELATTLAPTEADRLLQAEALVRGFCNWHIAPSRTETITLPGSGGWLLMLPSLHVTAVASITSDADPALTTDDYDWSEAGVLTARTALWTGRSISVAFTHGYDTPPAEVTAIVQAVAQRAIDNPGSKSREQAGPFVDSYSQTAANQAPALALLDSEKATLRRYRVPAVG
ncbi:MAG: hypothetical protein ACXVXP_00110 [Mycobacteriaceae bacterium]